MTDLKDLARRYPNAPLKKPVRPYRHAVADMLKRAAAALAKAGA